MNTILDEEFLENNKPELVLATFKKRLFAFLIDLVILLSISFGMSLLFNIPRVGGMATILKLLPFAYKFITELFLHRTIGKSAFGLLVVGQHQKNISSSQAFLRNIIYIIPFIANTFSFSMLWSNVINYGYAALVIGVCITYFVFKGRTYLDKIAETKVIQL